MGQTLFKRSDITSLSNKEDKAKLVLEAERFLQECRALVDEHEVPPRDPRLVDRVGGREGRPPCR